MNVLITGCEGLLGKEFAKAFQAAGHAVIGTDLPEHDVTNPAHWQYMVNTWQIDVLVNNAGITNNSNQLGFTDVFGAWDEILSVNLTGVMLGCKIVGHDMLAKHNGCIINIASQYALVAPHFDIYSGIDLFQPAAYSVSKAGVLGLTRYLSCLWGKMGIRVNAITPGGVENAQPPKFIERFEFHHPMGRMARPDEVTSAAVYIAENSYVNGANIVVDGGWSVW